MPGSIDDNTTHAEGKDISGLQHVTFVMLVFIYFGSFYFIWLLIKTFVKETEKISSHLNLTEELII